jgi:hypothetical protein
MPMIHRRSLLLGMAACAGLAGRSAFAFTVPASNSISFSVFRQGDIPMGYHRARFTRQGDDLIMEKEILLEVKLAFINAYRYRHYNREVWRDGRLVAIDTTTNDDGDRYEVTGRATEAGLAVESSAYGRLTVPADIIPTSYWNSAITSATQLLDTQRGLIMDVVMEDLGAEPPPGGGAQPARHHRINIQTNKPGNTDKIDLWYDDTGTWVGLAFEAKDQTIHYVLDGPGGPSPVPMAIDEAARTRGPS